MHLPNPPFPALLKRANRPVAWLILGVVSLGGCANATPSVGGFENFFTRATPVATASPAPAATPAPTLSLSPAPTPVAAETTGRASRRAARQARAASENAAAASKAAANASAEAAIASKQAATASKQAASVANQVEGTGPTNNDVSLEANPDATTARTPATPTAATSAASVASAPGSAGGTPTLSSRGLDSPESTGDANPEKAAKLIEDIDKTEKRVDRKNLNADDSQRDILAQKLLQEAKTALAERDNVAALSLANKASTLLEPLPKLADSSIPPAP
jgi:hypothetical protein